MSRTWTYLMMHFDKILLVKAIDCGRNSSVLFQVTHHMDVFKATHVISELKSYHYISSGKLNDFKLFLQKMKIAV